MAFVQTAIHYGSGVLMLLAVMYLYDKYKQKEMEMEYYENQGVIEEYLLNTEFHGNKPFLWIPLTYEANARQWLDFYSRKTTNMNQPYLEATIQSIIHHNARDFNVCIIDDLSYHKLMRNWTISLVDVPEPSRTHIRKLALMKLLNRYGGLIVPPSFLCIRSLASLYNQRSSMVAVEQINRSSSSQEMLFTPSFCFMGSDAGCPALQDGIQRFETMVSENHTHELEFWGQWNRWCYEKVHQGQMTLIDGKEVGVKREKREITLEDILTDGNSFDLFREVQYGVWIPQDEILKRTNYEWFARMSIDQIEQSQLAIANMFILAKQH